MIELIFGNLRVVKQIDKRYYECVCSCGTIVRARKDHLIHGDKTDCGCINKLNIKNRWIGKKFNKLIVIKLLGNRKAVCMCDCGNETIVFLNNLERNNTTSCGCVHKSIAGVKHGLMNKYRTEYRSWAMMKNRCLNPNCWSRKYYKDIHICDSWINSFESFFNDMGEKPEPKNKYSIDRINNSKGYSPENCKWSNDTEQSRNRRKHVIFS